jgi:hypothetical protein
LKAGLWFRRGRFVMLSPVHGNLRRRQAEIPLIKPVQFSQATSLWRSRDADAPAREFWQLLRMPNKQMGG